MHRSGIINAIIFVSIISSLVLGKMGESVWSYIAQISLLLSCYSNESESKVQNLFLGGILILIFVFGAFDAPSMMSAIVLMALTTICSIFKKEKTKIATQFLSSLILIALIFEYFSAGSLYYFPLDLTVYIIMIVGLLIITNAKTVSYTPSILFSLYCVGASFFQIQLFIIALIFIELLQGNDKSVSRASLLLLLWVSPGHEWAIVLYSIFIIPEYLRPKFESSYNLISFFAIGLSLAAEINQELKILIVMLLILISIKNSGLSKRVANA